MCCIQLDASLSLRKASETGAVFYIQLDASLLERLEGLGLCGTSETCAAFYVQLDAKGQCSRGQIMHQ